MSTLDSAIQYMEEAVAGFKHGTSEAPKEGSAEWFMLRGYVIGLAYLKRIRSLDFSDDVPAADRVYREAAKVFKSAEDTLA